MCEVQSNQVAVLQTTEIEILDMTMAADIPLPLVDRHTTIEQTEIEAVVIGTMMMVQVMRRLATEVIRLKTIAIVLETIEMTEASMTEPIEVEVVLRIEALVTTIINLHHLVAAETSPATELF